MTAVDRPLLGIEEQLWRAAEHLRGHVEPAEYKHVVLGLLFLRFATEPGLASSELTIPARARWTSLRARGRSGDLGAKIATVTDAIERANPQLAGVMAFDARRLGQDRAAALVDVIDRLPVDGGGGRDVLGRVYEYFLARFASSEGRSGGEYYTPPSVVELLVELARPQAGAVYDPCCGTGGMFVQSERLRLQAGSAGALAFFGQESSPRAHQIARMNLALRGLRADLGSAPADTFRDDRHPRLKADVVLANPPFNARAWGGDTLRDDARWRFGAPHRSSANFAWIQHILSHLKSDGIGAFVLANGSLSSDQHGESALRQRLAEADVIECIVALPAQLFYGTPIPACIWVVSPGKTRGDAVGLAGKTLFVDARARGRPVSRVHAELAREDIADIAGAYHAWRASPATFRGTPGFATCATLEEIRAHRFALVPGRYVGFAPESRRRERGAKGRGLDAEIDEVRRRLAELGRASTRVVAALEAMRRG